MEKRFKTKNILGSAVFFAIISQLLHTLGAVFTMDFYLDEKYFSVWGRLMMPSIGPPPTSFMLYGLIFAFITGILFTIGYIIFKDAIKIKNPYKRGAAFGFVVFLIAAIPWALSLILLINLPISLIISWTIEALLIDVLAGILIGKLN